MSRDDRFIDSIKQAYFLFARRPDGTITTVSPTVKSLLGYNHEEFIEVCSASLSYSSRINNDELLSDSAAGDIHIPPYDLQINHKDNTPHWLKITEIPIFNHNGEITAFDCLAHDITSYRSMERELHHSERNLRDALSNTIKALAMTVEARDYFSFGHHQRAASFARTIAQEMGMSSHSIDTIRMAAVVHDIGKISIPPEILNKRNQLNDIEYSFIQCHPETGYNILKDIDLPSPMAEIVLQHHERLNGSGYPRGLTSEEILPETKILMVADVMEAMASVRAHRPAMHYGSILEELSDNKGILFDADVVDVSIELLNEKMIVI
jgi:PAS domain S-box-containing protein